jgi:hypothetical protein
MAIGLLNPKSGEVDDMRHGVKTLLILALVAGTTTTAWAQAVGNWQKLHGQVQSVQGPQITVKTDDGRLVNVDMSQVSQTVQGAMAPNAAVTITGFPGTTADRFTARYIEQDAQQPSAAVAAAGPNAVVDRIVPLVPQFVDSPEFRNRAATMRNDRAAARNFVTQLYRGILDREPSEQERRNYVDYVIRTGDTKGTIEGILRSPEYVGKNKTEEQAIIDLYQGIHARTPSPDEVRTWQQMLARR